VVIEGLDFVNQGKHALRLRGCQYVRITRNRFSLRKNNQKSWWVYLDAAKSGHNRIDHNLFENKRELGNCIAIEGSEAPGLQVSQHDRIDHNHFRNVGPRHKQNGGETIRLGWSRMYASKAFTTVEENLFENCDGDAEIISVKCSDTVLRRNTFRDCQGALVLRHGDRSVVEANFFICTKGKQGVSGVRVIGDDHRIVNNYFEGLTGKGIYRPLVLMNGDTVSGTYTGDYHQVRRVLVAHNTWVDCVETALDIGRVNRKGPLEVKDAVIANNLVVGTAATKSGANLVEVHGRPENLTWSGNIMYHPRARVGIKAGKSQIRWVDPKLVRSADGIWRLSKKSPALDAARGNFPKIAKDLDGQPRDGKKDVGADEYSPDPKTRRRPLTPADVGPAATE